MQRENVYNIEMLKSLMGIKTPEATNEVLLQFDQVIASLINSLYGRRFQAGQKRQIIELMNELSLEEQSNVFDEVGYALNITYFDVFKYYHNYYTFELENHWTATQKVKIALAIRDFVEEKKREKCRIGFRRMIKRLMQHLKGGFQEELEVNQGVICMENMLFVKQVFELAYKRYYGK